MSSFQKQSMLDQLHEYLTSTEAMKGVMNSPGADKRGGKILSNDGTKAVFSNQNGFKNGSRNGPKNDWKKRGKKEKQGNQGKSNEQGSSSKSNQVRINLQTSISY